MLVSYWRYSRFVRVERERATTKEGNMPSGLSQARTADVSPSHHAPSCTKMCTIMHKMRTQLQGWPC